MHLTCDRIFNDDLIANLLKNLPV